ncbi:ATP-binding protein [Flavobacterium sp.]|uniref:ATP-binding protein n=1 Tax=Flavobacterium sp. TaxID=239 RepID=UPI00333E450B
MKVQYLFDVSNQYYFLKNYKLSITASKNAHLTALKIEDSLNLGRALYYIGDCYLGNKKDSAYYYYKESEKIFRKLNNQDRLAKVLYNKAYLLFYEGNYVESEIEVIKSLNYLKNNGKLISKYRCYSLQGSNHLELGEYDKALDYFKLSASVLNEMKKNDLDKDASYDYEITNTIDICAAYDKKGEYSKSIKLLEQIVKKGDFNNYPKLKYSVYGNLAYFLMKNKQYALSKNYFKEALKHSRKENDEVGSLYIILDFGEYHLLTKDTLKAKELFEKALMISKRLNNGKEILKSLEFLAVADKPNASNYKTEYIRINDSINKKQRENREKFTRIEYETDKVVEENKILSNKNLLLLLGLTISIAIFLIVLIIRNRISRKKELNLIQQKEHADNELYLLTKEFQTSLVEAKEHEQRKLSKELHDGIVNKIYGIRMMLGSINNNSDEASRLQRLDYIKELHKLETEVRDLSHDLNSDFSKYVGEFNFLLEKLIQNNNAIGSTQFISEISSTIDWNIHSSVIKINIYRILQELLQNVIKYAEAKKCFVQITEFDNHLNISVKDDGIGFNPILNTEGIGLKNIKERAKSIDSDIEIISNINDGTQIKFKVKIGGL